MFLFERFLKRLRWIWICNIFFKFGKFTKYFYFFIFYLFIYLFIYFTVFGAWLNTLGYDINNSLWFVSTNQLYHSFKEFSSFDLFLVLFIFSESFMTVESTLIVGIIAGCFFFFFLVIVLIYFSVQVYLYYSWSLPEKRC